MVRMIERIQTPALTISLAILLLIDAMTLGDNSTVGKALHESFGARTTRCYLFLPDAVIVNRGEGFVLIDTWDDEEHPQITNELMDSEELPVAHLIWNPHWFEHGWWRPTRRTMPSVRVSDSQNYSAEQLTRFREMFVSNFRDRYRNDPWASSLPVHSGGTPVSKMIWSGVLLNTASFVCAVGLLLSLGWIPKRLSSARAERAIASQQCPVCSYDLHDRMEHGCPECGWRRW